MGAPLLDTTAGLQDPATGIWHPYPSPPHPNGNPALVVNIGTTSNEIRVKVLFSAVVPDGDNCAGLTLLAVGWDL